MGKIFIPILSLYFITNIHPFGQDIKITLQDKKIVILSKSHESFNYFAELINRALSRNQPVGLLMSKDNKIIEVKRADNDIVKDIVAKDNETIAIYFQGHDGIFSLDRNHPHFNEIYGILEKSKINSHPVWFVAHHPKLKILDAIPVGEKK